MNRRCAIIVTAAWLTVLAYAASATAEERTIWQSSKGNSFENTQGDQWLEKSTDKANVNFVEKTRTDKFVEMWAKNGTGVRLFADHYDVKPSNEDKWKRFPDGKWVVPYRKVWVTEGSYIKDLGNGDWHEADPGGEGDDNPKGADRMYKETARNATYIELKLTTGKQWLRLYDKEVQVKNEEAGEKDFGPAGAGRWRPKN